MVLERKRCQESFLEQYGEANCEPPSGLRASRHGTHRLRDVTLEMKPRSIGGGSVAMVVQRLIWDHCICKAIGKCHTPYLKNLLKKIRFKIESNRDNVLDELYELYTEFMTSLKDDNIIKGNAGALKYISFLFPYDASSEDAMVRKMVVPLHCSLNMLEGDRGYVGSGVGLVGICLSHVKASKVILSDDDLSTLSNMKLNLRMNQMNTEDDELVTSECLDSVKCLHLPWECASESVLQGLKPDIILGADVIYSPFCPPHLVRVLAILLDKRKSIGSLHDYSDGCDSHDVVAACDSASNAGPTEHPMAYISSIIRNVFLL